MPPTLDEPAGYEERSVTVAPAAGGGPVRFRYRLLKPHVPAGQRLPLILFLHGAGERGTDNAAQLAYLPTWLATPAARQRHPCFILAPQCRGESMWVDIPWSDTRSRPQSPRPTLDLEAAIAALDAVTAAESVDADRVFLTGLSMGGYGTWDLAARTPGRFAAILPICGGGDEATAARIAAIPTWCFHGAADDVVPVERSRSMIAAVRGVGGTPRYSELPGVGHDAWTPAYRDPDVIDWLFAQRR